MINTNNYSQNRGSEFISSMTNYTYSDTFYKQIKEEEAHWYYPSFPQKVYNNCGKSIFNSGKKVN